MPSILNAYEKYKEIDFKDNKKFLKSLESHGIKQVFYYQIKNTEIMNRFTDEEIEDLKNTSLFNMWNMKLHEKDIESLYKRFNEEGIIAVALKGLATKQYYDLPELRVMEDADILIRQEDLNKVEELLNKLGYVYTEETTYHKVYRKNNNSIIEVHTSLIGEGKEIYKDKNPHDGIFDRIREIKIGNERAYVLGYTDQLIHLITHIMMHIIKSRISLKQILDIALFINNEYENIDFPKLKEVAIECNFYNLVTVILNICNELFGCKVPEILSKDCFNCNKESKKLILESLFSVGVFNEEQGVYKIGNRIGYSNGKYKSSTLYRYIKFLFPGYKAMNEKYGYCKKYRILLPLAWIHRIISCGSIQEKSISKKIRILIGIFKSSKKKNNLFKTLDL